MKTTSFVQVIVLFVMNASPIMISVQTLMSVKELLTNVVIIEITMLKSKNNKLINN
jgi:hypothetical protein